MKETKRLYKNSFGDVLINNLTNEELQKLWKMKKKRNSIYKIIITSDRCDYDDLSQLANCPEIGRKVGTFYYSYPRELELILKAFEGLFYQNIKIEAGQRFGLGVLDYCIYDDWWNEDCCSVCELCFLRESIIEINGKEYYTCRKKLNKDDLDYEKKQKIFI